MADKLKGQVVITGAAASFTGSNTIARIFASSDTTFESITFGTRDSAGNKISQTYADALPLPAGSYLEGPILYYSASAVTVAYIYD
tara:strand:+ start:405 stop:662 length:258 start_codon:yes stop_codon:yes gene_type:complete